MFRVLQYSKTSITRRSKGKNELFELSKCSSYPNPKRFPLKQKCLLIPFFLCGHKHKIFDRNDGWEFKSKHFVYPYNFSFQKHFITSVKPSAWQLFGKKSIVITLQWDFFSNKGFISSIVKSLHLTDGKFSKKKSYCIFQRESVGL